MIPPTPLEDVCGIWYYGKAGTGKSHTARQEYPDFFDKQINKWWDGYQGQNNVLLDDFDKKHEVLIHYIKRWADKYPFNAETKGSAIMIRPQKIIITSNYHPSEIWNLDSDLQPILRRFKITHFQNFFNKQKN